MVLLCDSQLGPWEGQATWWHLAGSHLVGHLQVAQADKLLVAHSSLALHCGREHTLTLRRQQLQQWMLQELGLRT